MKNKAKNLNEQTMTQDEIQARTEQLVAALSSEDMAKIAAKPEDEHRAYLVEFSIVSQNPDQPLPPRP